MIKVQKVAKISKNLLHNLQDFGAWLSCSFSVVPLSLFVQDDNWFLHTAEQNSPKKQNIIKISDEVNFGFLEIRCSLLSIDVTLFN